jgi:hypothetical protein
LQISIERELKFTLLPSNVIITLCYSNKAADSSAQTVFSSHLRSFLDILNETEIIEFGCDKSLRSEDQQQIFTYLRWRKYGVLPDNTLDPAY